MYSVHNCNVLYNNAVRPDIFDGLHFTHIENTSLTAAYHKYGMIGPIKLA